MPDLQKEIAEIKKQLKVLQPIIVEFETKTSETGIKLAGGPTTVKKQGRLLQILPMPVPNQPNTMMLSAVLLTDENTIEVVGPLQSLNFLDSSDPK